MTLGMSHKFITTYLLNLSLPKKKKKKELQPPVSPSGCTLKKTVHLYSHKSNQSHQILNVQHSLPMKPPPRQQLRQVCPQPSSLTTFTIKRFKSTTTNGLLLNTWEKPQHTQFFFKVEKSSIFAIWKLNAPTP